MGSEPAPPLVRPAELQAGARLKRLATCRAQQTNQRTTEKKPVRSRDEWKIATRGVDGG